MEQANFTEVEYLLIDDHILILASDRLLFDACFS